MPKDFRWTTYDLVGSLPDGWQQDIAQMAADADFRDFPRTPVLFVKDRASCTSRVAGYTPIKYGMGFPGCIGSTGDCLPSWPRKRAGKASLRLSTNDTA